MGLQKIDEHKPSAIHHVFGRESAHRTSAIESIEIATLIEWCEIDAKERFSLLSPHVKLFGLTNENEPPTETLSDDALDFLSAAPDKHEVIKQFYGRCSPSSWSGSRVPIMQSRRQALQALQKHQDSDVVKASKFYEIEAIKWEEIEAKREAERDSEREQKFE